MAHAPGVDPGAAERFGLCAGCRWGRFFRSGRDATYVSCERSRTEPEYPRFPAIPVVRCPGFVIRSTGFEPRAEDPGQGPNLEA